MPHRLRAWLDRWGPVLPLLVAEGTIALGFGALLPILPIYFTERGVDLAMLGVVVAAWPAARLVGEPILGWVADRGSRRSLMVTGLLVDAVVTALPLFLVGPAAFIALRLLAGLAAAAYAPAARGYLVDVTDPARRAEAFGLYTAAQMGGFMIGPVVGGIAADLTGDPSIVFWVAAVTPALSALLLLARISELPRAASGSPAAAAASGAAPGGTARGPGMRVLANRLLAAAVVLNVAVFLAAGTYEVVWSLYLTSLGADVGTIGLTFATFSLPVLLLSPIAGRLADRRGGILPVVGGLLGVAVCGALYPAIPEIWYVAALGLLEGTAVAFATPALLVLVARSVPPGRSSTAQGIFGAAGMLGMITASLLAGVLAGIDLRYPYYAVGVGATAGLVVGLVVGGRRLVAALRPEHPVPAPGAPAAAASAPGGSSAPAGSAAP